MLKGGRCYACVDDRFSEAQVVIGAVASHPGR